MLSITALSQQAPGSVYGQNLWHSEEDLPSLISNHRSFNLLQVDSEQDLFEEGGSVTLFFVLQPRYHASSGQEFMRVGSIRIYDDHIQYGRSSTQTALEDSSPAIVCIESVIPSRYGRHQASDIEVGDTSLFDIAELIVYPRSLTREERRKVSSYLALKYSITITQNEEEEWRDYLRFDNFTFWNRQIDGSHEVRVLGIGRLDEQRFYQTQTLTTMGEPVFVALDRVSSPGEMPEVEVEDDAFIILSESEDVTITSLECANRERHPLSNWKLQLQSWNSEAENLIVRIPRKDKRNLEPLYLTDGASYIPLQESVVLDWIEYKTPLDSLEDYRHYFFCTLSDLNCDVISLDPATNELTVSLLENEENLLIHMVNLTDGMSVYRPYSSDGFSEMLNPGQYWVSVNRSNGEIYSSRVVATDRTIETDEELSDYSIRLYPDPVAPGRLTTLSVQGLPGDGPARITITDMQGQLLDIEELDSGTSFEWSFNAPTVPATYNVSIYRGESLYSVKLIVAQ